MKYLLLFCVLFCALLTGCSCVGPSFLYDNGLDGDDYYNNDLHTRSLVLYCRVPVSQKIQVEKINDTTIKLTCVNRGDKDAEPR